MNAYKQLARFFQRSPAMCAGIYLVIMLTFFMLCWVSIIKLQAQRASLASAVESLQNLQSLPFSSRNENEIDSKNAIRSSPFLDGQTVTVAGASLLERVSNAIVIAGGRLLSSQVDLQTIQAKPGFISVIINCEVAQKDLQKLLFDLESGMPFLFINQLEIQPTDFSANSQLAPLHVLLSVSGQWLDNP